ncbi:protein farnesyltransferase/geranylgeranyltransferase type-1 subunit alpha-like [Schistocerca gregaria]|uniref:protein farnesyltransferase/geranylgeranyltransferase type-1 subunit alpha-like n=1 Tax=Schistocerca gregaria TaxID=7010 RepID=UPI00211E6EA0|nr:protein farnesyltransferase/geranylgeranyltransferase type-1 subunit alpha-like [Schistocerca gregaria]
MSEYQSWGKRKGWEDVEPTRQDDGVDSCVVSIPYSAEFEDTMNYMRTMMKRDEHSLRALEITREAIELCPGNYTLWCYRRSILSSLSDSALFLEEFSLTEAFIEDHPKCYQVWSYRQWLVEATDDLSREVKLCDAAIESDSKNYHAWSYRQWLVTRLRIWREELEYLDEMLRRDHWNNSVWNMRYFVVKHLGPAADFVEREIDISVQYIQKDVDNESPWNYLNAMVRESDSEGAEKRFVEFCQQCIAAHLRSVHPRAALVRAYLCFARSGVRAGLEEARAAEVCLELSELDPIRRKYWLFCHRKIKSDSRSL